MSSSPQSQFVAEFLRCLSEEGLNQAQFAVRCDVPGAKVSRFVSGARPEDGFLQQLCSEWKDPRRNRRMALAYLQDELQRTGLPISEFKIELKDPPKYPGLEADFDVIRSRVLDQNDPLLNLVSQVAAVGIHRLLIAKRLKRAAER